MEAGLVVLFAALAVIYIMVRSYRKRARQAKALYAISEEKMDMWYESLYRPLCGWKVKSGNRELTISRFVEAKEGLYTLSEACNILFKRARKMNKQGVSGLCYRVPLSASTKREQKMLDRLEAKLRKLEFRA